MGVIEKDIKRIVMLSDSETSSSPCLEDWHYSSAFRRRFFTTFRITIFSIKFIILNLSKHSQAKASARIFRQAQDDSQPQLQRIVIARNDAISKLHRLPVYKFVYGFLTCLVASVNVWAHSGKIISNDTSTKFIIRDPKSIIKSDKACFIVDDRYYDKDISKIDPKTIAYAEVIKNNAAQIYGSRAANGAVIILTKKYINNLIQSKLGKFSQNYRNYLIQHQNKDWDIEYVLNGLSLDDYTVRIRKLYHLPASKIKQVDLLPNPSQNGYTNKNKIVNIIAEE